MSHLVYFIGPPAAGKSTLMRALTAGVHRHNCTRPITHDHLVDPHDGDSVGIELGRARPAFPGTDALPMNVSPAARAFIAGRPAGLVLGEGDRLAHAGFLDAAAEAGYEVTAVYLTAVESVLDARCRVRGSSQSASWRQGRATKAANLAQRVIGRHTLISVDGAASLAYNVDALRLAVPALRALPETAVEQ